MFKGIVSVSFIKMLKAAYYNYGSVYLTQLNGETYEVLASTVVRRVGRKMGTKISWKNILYSD
jgi:hypothetical protein